MEQIKIQSLLNYLGETTETADVDILKHDNGKTIFVDNAEYIVLTEEEAESEYKAQQMALIGEMGLNALSKWARNEIFNKYVTKDYILFDNIQYETQLSYIEDLRYMGELDEEMKNANCKDEDEFLDYLCEDDSIEWFKWNYGEDEYNRIIINNDLIDWDGVIEFCKQVDGRGHTLATYDGEEIELDGDLYAYRVN